MLYKSSGCFLYSQNIMSMILWTSFFISTMCRKCNDFACVCACVCVYHILYLNQQISLATILWEQGNRLMYLPSQSLHAGWIHSSLSLSCFPSSLGRWFTFWFPTRHLVSTEWAREDQGFSLLRRPTTSFGHDGGFDQVLWVGCGPGSSHRMSGMFHSKCWDISTKGRHSITKVADTVAKLENWSVGKEFDSGGKLPKSVSKAVLRDSKQRLSIFRNLGLWSLGSWMLKLTHTLEKARTQGPEHTGQGKVLRE